MKTENDIDELDLTERERQYVVMQRKYERLLSYAKNKAAGINCSHAMCGSHETYYEEQEAIEAIQVLIAIGECDIRVDRPERLPDCLQIATGNQVTYKPITTTSFDRAPVTMSGTIKHNVFTQQIAENIAANLVQEKEKSQ